MRRFFSFHIDYKYIKIVDIKCNVIKCKSQNESLRNLIDKFHILLIFEFHDISRRYQ